MTSFESIKIVNRKFIHVARRFNMGTTIDGHSNMCMYLCMAKIMATDDHAHCTATEWKRYLGFPFDGQQSDVCALANLGMKFNCIFWVHEFDVLTGTIMSSSPQGPVNSAKYEYHLGHIPSGQIVTDGVKVQLGHYNIVDVIEEDENGIKMYLGSGNKISSNLTQDYQNYHEYRQLKKYNYFQNVYPDTAKGDGFYNCIKIAPIEYQSTIAESIRTARAEQLVRDRIKCQHTKDIEDISISIACMSSDIDLLKKSSREYLQFLQKTRAKLNSFRTFLETIE